MNFIVFRDYEYMCIFLSVAEPKMVFMADSISVHATTVSFIAVLSKPFGTASINHTTS